MFHCNPCNMLMKVDVGTASNRQLLYHYIECAELIFYECQSYKISGVRPRFNCVTLQSCFSDFMHEIVYFQTQERITNLIKLFFLLFHVIAFNKWIEKMFENIWELWHYRGVTVDTKHMLFIILPKTNAADAKSFSSRLWRHRKSRKYMLNKQGIEGYFDNISPPLHVKLWQALSFNWAYISIPLSLREFSFLIVLSIGEFLNYTENWIIFNETYPLWLAFQKKSRGARGNSVMKWALIHYDVFDTQDVLTKNMYNFRLFIVILFDSFLEKFDGRLRFFFNF